MTIAVVASTSKAGSADPDVFSHGLSISSGQLLVMGITRNDAGTAMDLPTGGSTWLEHEQNDGAETSRLAIWYKVAGGSEPSSYSVNPNLSTQHSLVLYQCSTTASFDTDPIDGSVTRSLPSSSTTPAIPAITVVAGAIAFAFVGADTSTGSANSVNNSYGNLISISNRLTGSAVRVHASAGSTGATAITFSKSILAACHHVSFKESAGGGGGRIMSSLAGAGGLVGAGGIAGHGGGLAGMVAAERRAIIARHAELDRIHRQNRQIRGLAA